MELLAFFFPDFMKPISARKSPYSIPRTLQQQDVELESLRNKMINGSDASYVYNRFPPFKTLSGNYPTSFEGPKSATSKAGIYSIPQELLPPAAIGLYFAPMHS